MQTEKVGSVVMTKTLVSLDNDLASGIALKYACQLANKIGMELLPIHVETAEQENKPPGAGWVMETWEKALLETSQGEISRIVAAEKASCRALGAPKITVGDPEEVILRELAEGYYDLFVEGTLYAFNSSILRQKILSRLYRLASCPVLIVKNLVPMKKLALLLEEGENSRPLISECLKVFEGGKIQVDLVCFRFQKAAQWRAEEEEEGGSAWDRGKSDKLLRTAKAMLEEKGWAPKECRLIHDTPTSIADALQDYSLVVSYTPNDLGEGSPHVDLLNAVPSAILLCRRH